MPQVGAHIVIADFVQTALNRPPDITRHPKAYYLGAVGPDMTLFLFDSQLGHNSAINVATHVLSTIQRYVDLYQEMLNRIQGPMADLTDWMTGGLSTDIKKLVTVGYAAVTSAVVMQTLPGTTTDIENPFRGLNIPGIPNGEKISIKGTSPDSLIMKAFRYFGHPYTIDGRYRPAPDNSPDKLREFYYGHGDNWWWMDILHYRRTARFARTLLEQAQSSGNDFLSAYSKGYFTHVAGDVCGHPYINAIVGGPFRNHALRHMVVENIVDSWVWKRYKHEDLVSSRLHEYMNVGDDFEAIAGHLVKVMKAVYTEGKPKIIPPHFPDGVPSVDDLESAYQRMMAYLRYATSNALEAPVPPPGSPQQFFTEIGDSLAKTAEKIPESFNNVSNVWEFLLAALFAALYALVLLIKLATLPAAILLRVATLAPRWLIYSYQLALYDFVRNARWVLALSGLGKVSSEELGRFPALILSHLPPQRTGDQAFNYPFGMVARDQQSFWLADPQSPGRQPERNRGAESCPYPPGATADIFITGPGYDQSKDPTLRAFNFPARGTEGPQQTVYLEDSTVPGAQFGNAVDFAVRLVNKEYPDASFDLDGDQGYGFNSWHGQDPEYSQSLT